jgi:competence protein ComEA
MDEEITFIDPNTADVETLKQISGIGPALADRIVANRPYADLEDLTRVAGIGPAFLNRLRPMIAFLPDAGPEDEPDAMVTLEAAVAEDLTSEEEAAGEMEALPAEDAATETAAAEQPVEEVKAAPDLEGTPALTAEKPDSKAAPLSRNQALGYALVASLFSFVFALIVVFAVLVAVNGSLRYANPQQIRDLGTEIEALQSEATTMSEGLDGLRARMDNIDALGGRVETLETGVSGLQTEMETVGGELDALQTQAEEISAQVDTLLSESEKYQSFINGLYEFIHDYAVLEEGTNE